METAALESAVEMNVSSVFMHSLLKDRGCSDAVNEYGARVFESQQQNAQFRK